MGATWASGSPLWFVRSMGTAELAGAIGIAAPALTGIMPNLTIVSAAGRCCRGS
ncbi:DoxX family protein [Bradyrhizobium ottawaense]|uniref:DoxX family protein n=1 Tax=Bradyrhizobium ottawaense TaxID=931866 RepID=UPI0038502B6C